MIDFLSGLPRHRLPEPGAKAARQVAAVGQTGLSVQTRRGRSGAIDQRAQQMACGLKTFR
jgi:hypothetical protein